MNCRVLDEQMHLQNHERRVSTTRNRTARVQLLHLTSQYMKVFLAGNEKEVNRIRQLIDALYSQHLHEVPGERAAPENVTASIESPIPNRS
jgi:hypothetical protein